MFLCMPGLTDGDLRWSAVAAGGCRGRVPGNARPAVSVTVTQIGEDGWGRSRYRRCPLGVRRLKVRAVAETRTVITVTHPQYWIIDRGLLSEFGPSWYRGFNGLVSAHGSVAVVLTGTPAGLVRLTIEPLGSESELRAADWDDVVEVSLWFEELGVSPPRGSRAWRMRPRWRQHRATPRSATS